MMMLSCKKKFKLDVINLGLKIFQKNKENKSEGKYRILQEGIEILKSHLDGRRIIQTTPEFFSAIAAAPEKKMTFDQITADFSDILSAKFKGIAIGSAIMQFTTQNSASMEPNSATIWIGRNNVLLMLGKEEIKSLQFVL